MILALVFLAVARIQAGAYPMCLPVPSGYTIYISSSISPSSRNSHNSHLVALVLYDQVLEMAISVANHLQQIHLGIGTDGDEPVAQYKTESDLYSQEHAKLQADLLRRCPAHLWYKGSYGAACPRPILINKHHQQQLEELHEALTAVIY